MADRKKELFELLNRDRAEVATSARRAMGALPPGGIETKRSRSEAAETPRSPEATPRARSDRRRGFGGRKVAVSLNVLLLFIGAFVATNVCSYIVGKGMAGETEVPLATEMRLFFAAEVTPPVAEGRRVEVWELHDRLRDAGSEQTEVLGLDDGKYLQIVAGRFGRGQRADCEALVNRVRKYFDRQAPRKTDPNKFVIPIDVRTITLSYSP